MNNPLIEIIRYQQPSWILKPLLKSKLFLDYSSKIQYPKNIYFLGIYCKSNI